jgi:hypothetical protein
MLQAMPGRHTIAITRSGYQAETREITVGNAAQDLPIVNMREAGGTVLVSSTPQGAAIFVDGKPQDKVTPSQIRLAPGSYQLTVEKDGKRAGEQITVANGDTKMLRLVIGQ